MTGAFFRQCGMVWILVTTLHVGLSIQAAEDEIWGEAAFSAEPTALLSSIKSMTFDKERPAQVLLREDVYSFKEDGTQTRTIRWMYWIETEQGVESWSQTQASWGPWFEARPKIRARVIQADGTVAWLDEANVVEVAEESGSEIYSDRRTLSAPFPAVQVGAVIEEVIEIEGLRPFFAGGNSSYWPLVANQPQKTRRLIIDRPKSLPFHFAIDGDIDLEPEIEKKSGRIRHTFTQIGVPERDEFEGSLPFDQSPWPRLNFATGKSWGAVANAYLDMATEQLAGESFEWVPQSAFVANQPFQSAVKLTHWLNGKVRYTGWELGESALRPTQPALCLKRGYGDCKDKALLVVGMLRKLGFSADIALLRSGYDYDANPKMPGLGRFNHAIVAVYENDKVRWLDPTDTFSRQGILHASNQGRWALIANKKTKALVRIPEEPGQTNRIQETRHYTFSESGVGNVTETTVYSGQFETEMRSDYQHLDGEGFKERLAGYANSTYRGAAIEKALKTEAADMSQPFQMELNLSDSGRVITDSLEAVVAVMFEDLLAYLPESLTDGDKDRMRPFVFSYPFLYEVAYHIDPLPGFEWLPDETEKLIPMGRGQLQFKVTADSTGSLIAKLAFDSGPRQISPETFNKYRADLKMLAEDNHVILRFHHKGEIFRSKGDYGKSMAAFRGLASQFPDSVIHTLRYATALSEAGLGERAIVVAKQACARAPESAEAHYILGNMLQRDKLSKLRGEGFDWTGASAAYEKALELKPDFGLARADLAILYEYDADGLRYTKNAKMEEALKHYLYLRENNPDYKLGTNIRNNLIFSRAYSKMIEEAKRTEEEKVKSLLKVMAISGLEDVDAGVAEARKIPDQDMGRQVLEEVGNQFLQFREYQKGAAFLRAAAQGSSSAGALEGRAQFLGKIIPFEKESFKVVDTPLQLIRKLFFGIARSGGRDFSFVEESMTEALFEEEISKPSNLGLNEVYRLLVAMADESILPLDMFSDLIINLIDLEVEGDETLGYHCVVKVAAFSDEPLDKLYVIQTQDGLKIYAGAENPELIGQQVLAFIDAGNVEAAKTWLTWRIEDSGGSTLNPKSLAPSRKQIWNVGDAPDPLRMRTFANTLIMENTYDEKAYAELSAVQEQFSGRAGEAVELVLGMADSHRKNYAKAILVYTKYFEKYPIDYQLFHRLVSSKIHEGDGEGLDAIFDKFLDQADHGQKVKAGILRSEAAIVGGDIKAALLQLEEMEQQGLTSRRLFNRMAWLSLFVPGYDEKGKAWIQEATRSKEKGYDEIHTLAVMYAEQGRCVEARETLLKAIKSDDRIQPNSSDWYVLARIAEAYGEMAMARELYGRVEPEESATQKPISTRALADKRLAMMKASRP